MAFSFNDGTLTVAKVTGIKSASGHVSPVYPTDTNIIEDLQQSYLLYLNKTVYTDMEYLVSKLREYPEMSNIDLDIDVKDLTTYNFMRTQVKNADMFYSVFGTFKEDGHEICKGVELLRVPYMDDYGKLNIKGKTKVLVCEQRSSEDISYNIQHNVFNISMPTANSQIIAKGKDIKMKYASRTYSIENVILSLMHLCGETTPLTDIFRNTVLLNKCKISRGVIPKFMHDSFTRETNLVNKLLSPQYNLGSTRDALNEALSLDRAVGCKLSRQTLSYEPGTVITPAMVSEFKKARLHCIYVENLIIPTGYYWSAPAPLYLNRLAKGFPLNNFLLEYLPQYVGYSSLPEDVELPMEACPVIPVTEPLTVDMVDTLRIYFNRKPIEVCAKPGSGKTILFTFEREIVDNYMAKLCWLTDTIPAGRYADEWVYYYDNPNLDKKEAPNLTCHDLIAIVSLIGEVLTTGKCRLLDRDASFLKKVQLVNETFSEHLRKTMDNFVKKYRYNIRNNIINNKGTNFTFITDEWVKSMNEAKVLATADTVNIIAEVSQVNHVSTITKARTAQEEQHMLAMPYFGRLCPYETPAGKQLGLVNTKAVGAKIINGILHAPYRKVISYSKGGKQGICISDKITYMSVKDELGLMFGDMLSFKYDENGDIMNTPVLARIPNPEVSRDKFIFKNIMAYELAGGYVSAYPEQFLSPTACLIPFACSNNVVRVSYGLSQIKQAIYNLHSEEPIVVTDMTKNIFNYSNVIKYTAIESGVIQSIDNNSCRIKTNTGDIVTQYLHGSKPTRGEDVKHLGSESLTFDILVKAGDKIKQGDLLCEAYKYPQNFVVKAPFTGYIRDITNNMIVISKNEPISSSVMNFEADDCQSISIKNGRIMGQSVVFTNIHVAIGDKVVKGQILADTCASRRGYYSPSRHPLTCYISYGYNHEDGVCTTERASINYTSLIAHKLDHTVRKRPGVSFTANLTQGFSYCGNGDAIGSIKSVSYSPTNGVTHGESNQERKVYATLKCNGIPFEIETVEDNKTLRKYRYHLIGFNKLHEGDKMSGRHGNKGVVSKVLKDSEAPQLMNGMTVEFILNPCGVPSRMNLGQMWELHTSLCAYILGIKINSNPFNGASPEDVALLLKYTHRLAHEPSIGEPASGVYNEAAFRKVCSEFPTLPQELHDYVWSNIENILDWRGSFNEDGTAKLYDPETDTLFDGDVTIGFPEFQKLMQEADEKLNVRSGPLCEDYAASSMQPQKNDYSAKGQRMGEMELIALAAQGTKAFIEEVLNEKGDNPGIRTNNHLKALGIDDALLPQSCYSRSVEQLLYLLEGVGIQVDLPRDIVDISKFATDRKRLVHLNKKISKEFSRKLDIDYSASNTESKDLEMFMDE